jgi:hypothetical protein
LLAIPSQKAFCDPCPRCRAITTWAALVACAQNTQADNVKLVRVP